MFSIATKTGSDPAASLPAGMEKITTSIKPIEFEPNECATLGRECGAEFSKELV
jgi:hypothetical protein